MEQDLSQVVCQWRERLRKALLTLTNRKRRERNLPPLQHAHVHYRRTSDLYLVNLKVWTLRYGVSVEFVLDAILKHYHNLQNDPKYRHRDPPDTISLHIPVSYLGGEKARQAVEDAVKAAYPNGENWRMRESEQLLQQNPLPRTHFDPADPDDYLRRYGAKIDRIRKEQEATLAARSLPRLHRNFRRQFRFPQ